MQEARVAALEHNGARADQAKRLLATMKQTQELQINHVMLLERKLAVAYPHLPVGNGKAGNP